MSISSEVRKAGPFAGNDVATAFPFAFKVFSTADVLVVFADAAGAETELVLGTDYTVSLNSDQNASPGGTVTLATALATGQKLVLSSQVALLQPVDLTNSGGFYPKVINDALDRATIQIQQVEEKVVRAWKIPISSDVTSADQLMADVFRAATDAVEAAIDAVEAADRVDLGALDAAVATSTSNASLAVAQNTAANIARAAAEVARDAATVNANVYASASAGLAAVADGQQFQVVEGEEVIRYRKDAGPVATEVARFRGAEAFVGWLTESVTGAVWAVVDEQGKSALEVDENGATSFAKIKGPLRLADVGEIDTDSDGVACSLKDELGRTAFEITNGGVLRVIGLEVGGRPVSSVPALRPASFPADVVHIIGYGQSLSLGYDAVGQVITTSAVDGALRFVGGVRPQDGGTDLNVTHASLVPLIESDSGTGRGETPSAGTALAIMQLVEAENGQDPDAHGAKVLLSCPGDGGRTVAQLSKGTEHYTRLMDGVARGYVLCQAAGQLYSVPAVTWVQGEANIITNTSESAYRATFATLVADLNADIKAVTGQADDVKVITYQTGSHLKYAAGGTTDAASGKIALAQLKLHEDGVSTMACPMYMLDYISPTNEHITATSSKVLGGYLGLAIKRVVLDGLSWSPLRPLAATKQGKLVKVQMHVPSPPLVFDTDWVSENDHYGFELVDSGGSPLTISSVSIIGSAVKIVAAADVPAGARVRYAMTAGTAGGQTGRLTGARGNLRDSQGDTFVFDPSGVNRPLHNWSVMFSIAIG